MNSEEAANCNRKRHCIFFGLGTNIGDKQANIENAYQKIEERIGPIVAASSLFITQPEGFVSENLFVNSACEVLSELDYTEVLSLTQSIEKEMGRTNKSQNSVYSDRVIDIDILLFDHLIINTPQLIVPHPKFHTRLFVLNPLSEIAPHYRHPILNQTIHELKVAEEERRAI